MREKKMNAEEKKENHSNRAEKCEPPRRIFLLSSLTSHVNTQTDYIQLWGSLKWRQGEEKIKITGNERIE